MNRLDSLIKVLSTWCAGLLCALAFGQAVATTGAANTTDDPGFVDNSGYTTQPCSNGPSHTSPLVNCNQYGDKRDVFLSGLVDKPSQLGAGTYFFAVLDPGGQKDPNDGTDGNLSNVDTYVQRTFSVDGNGVITNLGTHSFDPINDIIQLVPYDDTPNPGGVYILAVCEYTPNGSSGLGAPGVTPSSCKYDAFKVQSGIIGCTTCGLSPPTIGKDAVGAYTTTWKWGISKSVDPTRVEQVGGTATFNYTISVTHDTGTDSGVGVTGTITVNNPNPDTFDISGVIDILSDGTLCTVTNGGAQTLQSGDTSFSYSCTLSSVPTGELDNTATVSWGDNGGAITPGSADATFPSIAFTQTLVDNCVSISDKNTFDGITRTFGPACKDDPSPDTFGYSITVPVPQFNCLSYDNTATFTTNTTGTTGSAGQTVTVCGPAKTGALTMGFWQNKNGQGIISGGAATGGVCNSGTWLRQYAPFQDLSATANCGAVATYVYNVIKAANAGGSAMNAMLKAQMLATALDVYFSDPALGGNKINAPAPIGGVSIDVTKVCKMIDGTGGTATCSGSYEDTSSAFGGGACQTVSALLTSAAIKSNVGGSMWYANVKATQQLAKDTFDAINNMVAFGC